MPCLMWMIFIIFFVPLNCLPTKRPAELKGGLLMENFCKKYLSFGKKEDKKWIEGKAQKDWRLVK
jgi:hypothetical protein